MLAFLIVVSIVLSIVYAHLTADDGEVELPDIREELGEDIYVGMPIAYPRLEEAEIVTLLVENKKSTFDLTRWPDENGEFWLGYKVGDGDTKMIQYIPPIVGAEGEFDYESLYAVEQNDGYGRIYMLSYLCSAVGTVYFQQRIDLPVIADSDSAEVKAEKTARRAELLEEYGLTEGEATRVSFAYAERDKDGNIITEAGESGHPTHHIQIGDTALNGQGYYFRVDGRDCIYYTSFDSFKYALMGFHAFIKGMLVAEGLPEDTTFEPLLTTDFKQWKNTIYENGEVQDGSNVVAKGNAIAPIKESATYKPEDHPDGYYTLTDEDMNFDLSKLAADMNFARIKDALVGKTVGSGGMLVTLISEPRDTTDMIIDFGSKSSLTYTYNITKIESILDYKDGALLRECVDAGAKASDCGAKLLRVSYDYYIDGEKKNTVPRHAVINLDDALIPDAAKTALSESAVGALASAVDFSITYTKDNALRTEEKLVITDIVGIFEPTGKAAQVVAQNSYVSLRYNLTVDGVKGETKAMTISMKESLTDTKTKAIAEAILGKKVGTGMGIVAFSDTYYHEALSDFNLYEIEKIEAYIVSELVVSFRFQNESERDPFYGESIYENTTTGKHSLYGLNASACQAVLKVIGGLGEDTSHSTGMAGTTVAVGLTHKNMLDYGLYAHTIYIELPRGIYDATVYGEEEDPPTEYGWHDTLGFTLYISEIDYEKGTRYVGSDMYDLVAEIPEDAFEFIDYSFAEFWARRNLVLVETSDIENFEIDFFMEDLKGGYNFEIFKKTYYIGSLYGEYGAYESYFEGSVPTDRFFVNVTLDDGEYTETEVTKLIEGITDGEKKVSVTNLYNKIMGGGEELYLPNSIETVGVSNFMLAFQLMQMSTYQGVLSEEEQEAARNTPKLMSIKLKLKGESASPFTYVYDFYRASDRKIMVSTYRINKSGTVIGTEVSDFYLSTFSFKKLVNGYLSVFNAKEVDCEIPYTD